METFFYSVMWLTEDRQQVPAKQTDAEVNTKTNIGRLLTA
jgi:hypothetical protein